jgi:hypothetical protein
MPTLLNAFIWIAVANFLGLVFGWASIQLSTIGKKSAVENPAEQTKVPAN